MTEITTMRGSEKVEFGEGKWSATRRKQIYKSDKYKRKRRQSVTASRNMKRLSRGKFLPGRRRDALRVTETEIRATDGVG